MAMASAIPAIGCLHFTRGIAKQAVTQLSYDQLSLLALTKHQARLHYRYTAARAAACARIASTSCPGGSTSRITMSGAASGATSAPCMFHCPITADAIADCTLATASGLPTTRQYH